MIKPYDEFVTFIHANEQYRAATDEQRASVNERLEYCREFYEKGMSGADIEALFKFNSYYGFFISSFYGVESPKQLIDSVYGNGACEQRYERKRKEREEKYAREGQQRIEKEKELQLSEPISYCGERYTIKEFIDYLFKNNYTPSLSGGGVCLYYKFSNTELDSSYRLSKPIFRKKHVMEYIKSKL